MIQIIEREEGKQSKKVQLESGREQISFNSDGRLAIRVIHDCNRDTLVVLDSNVSTRIIEFCQFYISDNKQKLRDIPF